MQTKPLLTFAALALMLSVQQAIAQYPGAGMPYGQPAFGVPMAAQMAPGVHPQALPPGVQPAAFNRAVLGAPGCEGKGCEKSCCRGWCHCTAVWGDFLYLRARDAEVAYAVENNGPAIPNVPIQVGRIGTVDQDFSPGFRFGFARLLDDCTSVGLQYTMFESSRTDRVDRITNTNAVRSLVFHPSTFLVNADSVFAQATHDISFDLIDADYRQLISYSDDYQVNFLAGLRYTRLEQRFSSIFPVSGQETVTTEINFDGVGPRFGLEGEWYTRNRRWLAYGKTYASFMSGKFGTDYHQGQNFDASVVNTNWRSGRVVSILDLEAGFGWQSQCKTWRITLGYTLSAWFNVIKTDEWIQAVQRNNFVEMEDQMTFDGLVGRLEARF